MRAGKVISGSETVIADLNKNKISVVFLASDLQKSTLEKVNRAVKNVNVPIVNCFDSEELAHAIGKERKVIAFTDIGFYEALAKLIDKGV